MEHSHGLPKTAPIRPIPGVRDGGATRIRRHVRPAHQPYARPAQTEPTRSKTGPIESTAPTQTRTQPTAAGLVQTLIQTATSLVTSLWGLLPFDRRALEPTKQTRAQDPGQGASPAKADWLIQAVPSGKRARLDYTLRSARSAESRADSDALNAHKTILPPLKEYYAPSQADASVLLASPIGYRLPVPHASQVPSVLREYPVYVDSASGQERRTRKRHHDVDEDVGVSMSMSMSMSMSVDDRSLAIVRNHAVDEPVVVETEQREDPSTDDDGIKRNEKILTSDVEPLPQNISVAPLQALSRDNISPERSTTEDDQSINMNDLARQRKPVLFHFGSCDVSSGSYRPIVNPTCPGNKPILFSFEPGLENGSENTETQLCHTHGSGAELYRTNESLPQKMQVTPNPEHQLEPSAEHANPTAPMLFSFLSKGHEQQTQNALTPSNNPRFPSFSSSAHEAIRSLVPKDSPLIFLFARDVFSS